MKICIKFAARHIHFLFKKWIATQVPQSQGEGAHHPINEAPQGRKSDLALRFLCSTKKEKSSGSVSSPMSRSPWARPFHTKQKKLQKQMNLSAAMRQGHGDLRCFTAPVPIRIPNIKQHRTRSVFRRITQKYCACSRLRF